MAHTDSKNIAFAYAGDCKSIIDICNAAGYKHKLLSGTESDMVYATGIDKDNNVILTNTLLLVNDNFTHIQYAKLVLAMQNELSMLQRICDKCSRTGIIMEQKHSTPIYRFKNNAVYAKDLHVEPWEHMLFTGDYVVCFIWDTRQVTKVLHINDCKELSKRMLVPANDNNEPLVWPGPEADISDAFKANCIAAYNAYYVRLEPSGHPMMTGNSISDKLLNAMLDNETGI